MSEPTVGLRGAAKNLVRVRASELEKSTRAFSFPALRRLGPKFHSLATYDAFPAFSAKVRHWFYNPLGVLILSAGVALLCGLFLHPQGFALLGGLLLVIVLGLTWPSVTLLGLRGSLRFEQARTSEGQSAGVHANLTNRLPWAAYGLAIEAGLDEAEEAGPDTNTSLVGVASAPGWRSLRCRWDFSPARRGVYPLVSPCLSTGFPFGLWKSKRSLAVASSLLVWPRTYPVAPAPRLSVDQQVEGNFSPHKVGMSGDVLGVRPYRRGDSLRRVHWGQTARHDRLIVCEFQANARPVIQLVLDTDPAAHAGRGSGSSREWAIRIVASLAKGWIEAGLEIGGVWDDEVIAPASGQLQIERLLDSLARVPDVSEQSLAGLLARPACRNFSNGLQVIVTTDSALARTALTHGRDEELRWVVLQTSGFQHAPARREHPGRLPIEPWLLIDRPENLPWLLHSGSQEALHGS